MDLVCFCRLCTCASCEIDYDTLMVGVTYMPMFLRLLLQAQDKGGVHTRLPCCALFGPLAVLSSLIEYLVIVLLPGVDNVNPRAQAWHMPPSQPLEIFG